MIQARRPSSVPTARPIRPSARSRLPASKRHDEREERPVEHRAAPHRPGRGHSGEQTVAASGPDAEPAERLGRDRQDFRRAQCWVTGDLEIVALDQRRLVGDASSAKRARLARRHLRSLPRAQRRGHPEGEDTHREHDRRERLVETDRSHHGLDGGMCGRPFRDRPARGVSLRDQRADHRPDAGERQKPGRKPWRTEEPEHALPSGADHLTAPRALTAAESTTQRPPADFTTVYVAS